VGKIELFTAAIRVIYVSNFDTCDLWKVPEQSPTRRHWRDQALIIFTRDVKGHLQSRDCTGIYKEHRSLRFPHISIQLLF